MPLKDDTKKKLQEILQGHDKDSRIRILRMAAINHELNRRKAEQINAISSLPDNQSKK